MSIIRFTTLIFCLLAISSTAQDRFSDCEGAIILCDKSDIIVKKLYGTGQELSEVGFASCSDRLQERNTVWLKWQVGRPGSIEFSIVPLESGDDLDFIVWRLDDDIRQCSRKFEIRCMASGEHIGAPAEESFACMGRMGLSRTVSDTREYHGCGDEHDNYLAAIDAREGDNYILYINNYTSDNGFKLEWSGDAEFIKPKELEIPETDQTQMSKAIYFKKNGNGTAPETSWQETALDKGFLAKAANSRSPNIFAGCTPGNDNIEKTQREQAFTIGALYPNPTPANTNIALIAPYSAVARVEMYDILGKLCFTQEYIVDRGEQVLQLPTDQLSAGFYFAQIRAGKTIVTKKLIIVALK